MAEQWLTPCNTLGNIRIERGWRGRKIRDDRGGVESERPFASVEFCGSTVPCAKGAAQGRSNPCTGCRPGDAAAGEAYPTSDSTPAVA
jgi:hypothetical protein